MEIRIKETGQVVLEQEFRRMYPNTSMPIPLTLEVINEFGGDIVLQSPQPQPTRYQFFYRDGVEQIDGKWYTKYAIADLDAEGKALKDAEQAENIRQTRDKMLQESDWTQLADASVDKQAWANYRQTLRDITIQDGFPFSVVFPDKPTE